MPSDEAPKPYLNTETDDIKAVSDYTRLDFSECLRLDCFTFRRLLHDAIVYKMRQKPEGEEYLENCWLLTQTNPDKENLRNTFGKGGI